MCIVILPTDCTTTGEMYLYRRVNVMLGAIKVILESAIKHKVACEKLWQQIDGAPPPGRNNTGTLGIMIKKNVLPLVTAETRRR